jgi:hypothetical protein
MRTATAATLLTAFLAAAAPAAAAQKPLPEGFPVNGFDGKLSAGDESARGKTWFFEFDLPLVCGTDRIEPGFKLEILPSAAAEKMTSERPDHPGGYYRLWGRLTRYRAKNFLFVIYFLPVTEPELPQESASPINEPNDSFAIPDDILARLGTRPVVRADQLRKGLELEQDSVLSHRSGRIVRREGAVFFKPDGLGRNIERIELELLPCQPLAKALRASAGELEIPRFAVSGLVTSCGGRHYLLLERATEVYSYGNFAGTQ